MSPLFDRRHVSGNTSNKLTLIGWHHPDVSITRSPTDFSLLFVQLPRDVNADRVRDEE